MRYLIIFALCFSFVTAQVSTDVFSKTARSAALAGSQLAHGGGANALFSNPATMVDDDSRSFLAGYQRLFSQEWLPYTVAGATTPLGAWGEGQGREGAIYP